MFLNCWGEPSQGHTSLVLKNLQVRPVCYPLEPSFWPPIPMLILYFQGLVIPHERHRHLPPHMGGQMTLEESQTMVRATGEIVCLCSTVLRATPRGADCVTGHPKGC